MQASYLVRMLTLLRTFPETQHIYWYLLCDFQQYQGLGLLRPDTDPYGKFTPGMMYPAYANLIDRMYGTTYVKQESTGDTRTRVYRFAKGDQTVFVCWSTFGDSQLTFQSPVPLKVVNLVGGESEAASAGGQVRVALEQFSPVYVLAPANAVAAVGESPRPDKIVADSMNDFSSTEGQAGWTYGYYTSNNDGSAAYVAADVKPMTLQPGVGDQEDRWVGPVAFLVLSQSGCQPQASHGKQVWAVRRWTSTMDGPARIVVQTRLANKGDGVIANIYLDGKLLTTKFIAPKSVETIDLPVTLQKGSQIDVAVTPGRGLDSSFDNLGCRVTILSPR